MIGIADTGFIVAFLSSNDEHNDWAVNIAERLSEPLLTCEAVLAEAAFHIGNGRRIFDLLNDRIIVRAFDCNDQGARREELAERYADRKPDFADLRLDRMSELFPKYPVITVDR